MPMYDFECKACGHAFEAVAKVDELPPCPSCNSADVARLISTPMITGKVGLNFKSPGAKGKSGRPKTG
jgi:putative FmdB family regulatory protein